MLIVPAASSSRSTTGRAWWRRGGSSGGPSTPARARSTLSDEFPGPLTAAYEEAGMATVAVP